MVRPVARPSTLTVLQQVYPHKEGEVDAVERESAVQSDVPIPVRPVIVHG